MARAKSTKSEVPTPIHTDGRTCFALAYFLKEADAQAFGDYYKKHGATYNGGYFHGMPCGRDAGFDFVVTEAHKSPDLQAWQKMGKIYDLPVGTKIYAATY